MGGFAEDLHRYLRLGRCCNRDGSHFSVGIQREAHICIQMRRVHGACAHQPRLFACRNDELNLAVRQLLLLNDPDCFEQGSQSRFVIRSKNGTAITSNPAVFPRAGLIFWPGTTVSIWHVNSSFGALTPLSAGQVTNRLLTRAPFSPANRPPPQSAPGC